MKIAMKTTYTLLMHYIIELHGFLLCTFLMLYCITHILTLYLGLCDYRHGNYMNTFKLCNANRITTNSLQSMAQLSSTLKSLHLCNVRAINDTILSLVVTNCTRLESLSLYGCVQLTDSSIQLIGTHCTRLNELSLRSCVRLTNQSLIQLPCTLYGLNISGCKLINHNGIISIAKQCHELRRLNLHGCDINDSSIDIITSSCPYMETLHISSSNPFGGNTVLTNLSLHYLCRLSNTLQCLNMQGASTLTDHGFTELLSTCTQLLRLNIGGCYQITDHTILLLGMKLYKLTHLSLFQCYNVTDQAIITMITKLHHLQHIDLHSCIGLTSSTIHSLIEPIIPTESQLQQSEQLGDQSLYDDDVDGTTTHNRYRLPDLISLDIGSCRNIDRTAVDKLKQTRNNINVIFY